MNFVFIVAICGAAIITSSCSEKSEPAPTEVKGDLEASRTAEPEAESEREREEAEPQPAEEEIGEDCVRFVRATKTTPAKNTSGDCPGCPVSGGDSEVLQFIGLRVDRVSCRDTTCDIAVTIRATFNPGKGGTIVGGLTGWITPEQRAQYEQGQAPSGEQVYRVNVIYKKTASGWRAVEFDRVADQNTPSSNSRTSGIAGTIFVSPNRPGPIRKDEPPRKGPAGNVTFVVKKEGLSVGSFTTDPEGNFNISLPPGHYLVLREDVGANVGRWRFEADVAPGEMTRVQWTADSGMR